MTQYKTLRLRKEDYEKLKDVQRLLRRKGTETINWTELREQDTVELPDDDDDDNAAALTAGFVIGLGAAALAYLVYKGIKESQE
ncbi:MAG: hypothetical protein L3K14_04850 [Thermoplasmata archaeon]|nr:hypothetical protein [Thermoplasmata archaeon]